MDYRKGKPFAMPCPAARKRRDCHGVKESSEMTGKDKDDARDVYGWTATGLRNLLR